MKYVTWLLFWVMSWLGLKPALEPATTQPVVLARERFDLDTVLLRLSEWDELTLGQALASIHIWGGTGSGKTSSVGFCLATALMQIGAGFLCLCVKPGDRADFERYARRLGLGHRIVVIGPDADMRINLLDYELRRDKGGLTENLLNIMTIFTNIVEGTKEMARAADPHWERSMRVFLRNAIDLLSIAGEVMSLENIQRFILSAPLSKEELEGEEWKDGYCFEVMEKASEAAKTARQKHDFTIASQYYLHQFPLMPDRTRGGVLSTLEAMADVMLHGLLWELFSTDTTWVPETIWQDGAIVIVDIDINTYGEVARIVGGMLKYITQRAMLRRDVSQGNDRPSVIWVDEASAFLSPFDYTFASRSRSARCMSVYLNQSIANYYASMGAGGQEAANALMSNLQTQIWFSNADYQTNEWASKLIGQHWMTTGGYSTGSSVDQGGKTTTSGSEAVHYKILPETFTRLLRGGPPHNRAEAVIFQSGRIWKATGDTYLMTSFPQEPRDGV